MWVLSLNPFEIQVEGTVTPDLLKDLHISPPFFNFSILTAE